MSVLTNSVYDAIQVFIDSISPGTTVVKAVVEECVDEAKNEYRLKYLSNSITAISNSSNVYLKDDEVYVLVPNNDFQETLVIIASAGQEVTTAALTELQKYYSISNNLCKEDGIFRLSSYGNQEFKYPLCDDLNLFEQYFNNYMSFKIGAFFRTNLDLEQRKNGNYGFEIHIPVINKIREKTINDDPSLDENKKKDEINNIREVLVYKIDINNMRGNPYNLNVDTEQTLIINKPDYYRFDTEKIPYLYVFCKDFLKKEENNNINYENAGSYDVHFYIDKNNDYIWNEDEPIVDFEDIDLSSFTEEGSEYNIGVISSYGMYYSLDGEDRIYYSAESITESKEGYIPDIFIRNIYFTATEKLSEEELKGYNLTLDVSDGICFAENLQSDKVISPILLVDGKQVLLGKDIKYYWFIEDPTIKTDSKYYMPTAGLGWKCINPISIKGYTDEGIEILEFDSSINTITISKDDVTTSLMYKCIIEYRDTTVSKVVTISNKMEDKFNFILKTDKELYVNSIGEIEVIAQVQIDDDNVENYLIDYEWLRFDKDDNLIEEEQFFEYIINNELNNKTYTTKIKYPVYKMIDSNIIQCSAYYYNDVSDRKLIATKRVRISTAENLNYYVNIIGDNILYKYDADGDSPATDYYDGPISSKVTKISPLNFKMYHIDGQELTESEYEKCKVTWVIPKNSMMEPIQGNYTLTDDDKYSILGKQDFFYGIALRYDKMKSNDSNFILKIEFDGNIIEKPVNIQFLKDGDSGTNGTKFSALLTYDGYPYGKIENGEVKKLNLFYYNSKWYYYNNLNKQYLEINNVTGLQLVPKVYKDGVMLQSNEYNVTYKFFNSYNNKQIATEQSKPPFNIDNNGRITVEGEPSDDVTPIIQAEIQINNEENTILYCYYPIEYTYLSSGTFLPDGITFNDTVQINPHIRGGFDSVLYNTSGENPEYDSREPFVCNFTEKIDEQYKDCFVIEWNKSNNLQLADPSNNLGPNKVIKPIAKYLDSNAENYVKVTCNPDKEITNKYNSLKTELQEIIKKWKILFGDDNKIDFKIDNVEINWTEDKDNQKKYLKNILTNYINSINTLVQWINTEIQRYKNNVVLDEKYVNDFITDYRLKKEDIWKDSTIASKDKATKLKEYLMNYKDDDSDGFGSRLKQEVGETYYNTIKPVFASYHVLIENNKKLSELSNIEEFKPYSTYYNIGKNVLNKILDLPAQETFDNFQLKIKDIYKLIDPLIQLEYDGQPKIVDNKIVVEDSVFQFFEDKKESLFKQYESKKKEYNDYTKLNKYILDNNWTMIHIKPIMFSLNRYEMGNLNMWDGNKIETEDSYILAPQVGAGIKNSDNTFTGIVMGVASTNKDGNSWNNNNRDIGLFGYSSGARSIFLDAKTGSATFGISGGGQIIIDPTGADNNGKAQAIIKSGNYSTAGSGAGMQIDFSTPSINFGSGNFSVSKEGYLTAKGGGSIAGWNIGTDSLTGGFLTLNSNGSIYSNTHNSLTDSSSGFFLSSEGLSIGGKFKASKDGILELGNLSSTNHWTISNNDSNSYIRFGDKEKYNDTAKSGVYIGTDGIGLGGNFYVDVNGNLKATSANLSSATVSGKITANSGKIGGWEISGNVLQSNNNKLILDASGNGGYGSITIPSPNSITFSGSKDDNRYSLGYIACLGVNCSGVVQGTNFTTTGKTTTGSLDLDPNGFVTITNANGAAWSGQSATILFNNNTYIVVKKGIIVGFKDVNGNKKGATS